MYLISGILTGKIFLMDLKTTLKDFKHDFFGEDIRLWRKKAWICFAAIFGMGFFLSFLIMTDYGTDPYTFMNLAIVHKLHMLLGTWKLIFNTMMLIIVIVFNRKLIGIGTIFNMVLIGYYADFFTWLWAKILPESLFTAQPQRSICFAIALLGFVISAAVYMNSQVGLSPYDGTGKIVADALHMFPFFAVRICYDFLAILVGVLAGGKPTIGIILMAIALGPFITLIGKKMAPMFAKMSSPGNSSSRKSDTQ